MQLVRYNETLHEVWDTMVRSARNGVFLFERAYMEYHADRYLDCSLLFYRNGKLIALLPAHFVETDSSVASHNGLTYGGFITSSSVTTSDMLELFAYATNWFRTTLGATTWFYKPIPYIYAQHPSQEDLYALFCYKAELVARKIASVVELNYPLPFRSSRKQGIKRALKEGVTITESESLADFWQLLDLLLHEKYRTTPVHTLQEMKLLKQRFPNQIKLFNASINGVVLGGCVIYETAQVAHCQYITSSPEGRCMGVLDALFSHLIQQQYAQKRYFDLGTSTEGDGTILNTNLIFQKEGFGARGVVYETYKINLSCLV